MSDHLLILRLSGDFYTKARNTRLRFQNRLATNLQDALKAHGVPYRLQTTWSRFYLETPDPDAAAAAAEIAGRVFGIQSASVVERRPWETLDDVVRLGVEMFADGVRGRTFAVRATRRGDRNALPFDSQVVEIALGRALLDNAPGSRVHLDDPQVVANVELEPGLAHLFHDKVRGHGGLPIGVEGRALALVSGGFDSAVASWLMLKRGVHLDYLFCNLGGSAHRLGVLQVMKTIADRWSYGTRPRLFEVDLQPLIADLQAHTLPRNWQIVLKRLMLRAGDAVARAGRHLALVTGDAIGQVSSQTLPNLAVISQATPMTVLRPLVGFNKEEILRIAREIGIYEHAAAVGEYCDLVPKKPATKALLKEVLRGETALDAKLLDDAVDGCTSFDLRLLDTAALRSTGLETREVPDGATVLDLRSRSSFDRWHYPGALHFDLAQALASFESMPRDRAYVTLCEVGLKSAHLAERMRQAGLRAWYFEGGLPELMAEAERRRLADPALAALLAPAVRD